MRYQTQDDVLFSIGGRDIIIKEPLPYVPPLLVSTKVIVDAITALDEVASRANIYGDNMESECYRIFDENVIELFEARFKMENVSSLRIP